MDLLLRVFERLVARLTGPMQVQPTIAVILGIRAGIHDFRQATPPFIWSLCTRPEERKPQLKQALEHLWIPNGVAIVVDGIAQFLLFERIRVPGAVVWGRF